jgi:hypothetical protein
VKLSLAIVPAVFLAAACTESGPEPTTTPPAPTSSDGADGVTLRVATPERLVGSYLDASGLALRFEAARDGDALYLHLETGDGRELVHAETLDDVYRFRYLGGRLTLTVERAWVAEVRAEGQDGPAAARDDAFVWEGDMAVLDEMLAIPEVAALPWMSRALGAQGITGADYPASLALHKVARQSADGLGIDLPPLAVDNAPDGADKCSRPTANECYGMCGPGCSCWSWVCGDCCYHYGCARHDSWCRNGQWYYCYNITAVIALFGC